MRVLAVFLLLLQPIISVHTELVVVPVSVTDAAGNFVAGLTQNDFAIRDNGKAEAVAVFVQGDVPVTLGLVVDRSQSMRAKGPALRMALAALLGPTRPDDELFGVNFDDEASLALAGLFTSDRNEIAVALSGAVPGGRTALIDGVAEGLRHLPMGHSLKNALVIISDGGDNASRSTPAEVLALARRSQAVIYAIGLLGTPPVEEEEDAQLLIRLCKDTGGVAYFPKSLEEISTAARQIARDLREQYTLGFSPGPHGGAPSFRKIEVTVSAAGRGRLHVRTRAGYLTVAAKDVER
jgi:Ca-activated chloride channel homolog